MTTITAPDATKAADAHIKTATATLDDSYGRAVAGLGVLYEDPNMPQSQKVAIFNGLGSTFETGIQNTVAALTGKAKLALDPTKDEDKDDAKDETDKSDSSALKAYAGELEKLVTGIAGDLGVTVTLVNGQIVPSSIQKAIADKVAEKVKDATDKATPKDVVDKTKVQDAVNKIVSGTENVKDAMGSSKKLPNDDYDKVVAGRDELVDLVK